MADYSSIRKKMVEKQIKARGITDKNVISAMLEVPRENFVLREYEDYAYNDSALPLENEQTISQPYIVALMTELLEPKKSDIICEIGTGSGYHAAILSKLCMKVVSFEIIADLCEFAKDNLYITNIDNVSVVCDDGTSKAVLRNGPYDKIIATATGKIPSVWIDSLMENGILVVPEKDNDLVSTLRKYRKVKGRLELEEESIPVSFVSLISK